MIIMGNEQSQLKDLEIEDKAIEVTDYWSLYSGEISNSTSGSGGSTLISIFEGESIFLNEQNLWTNNGQSPIEKASKNLMIYRHPSILKYVHSWDKSSVKYLATERCKPLHLCLSNQNSVQICLGLRSILCSLIFMVEQAHVRHLNICASSIYVTPDGTWRMAGLEHLWKDNELSNIILERSQSFRHQKTRDPNEVKNHGIGIEQFSFGVLCEEILSRGVKDDAATPFSEDFRNYCVVHLKHENVKMRPKLSAILLHPYFNHEFILVHSFLCELPLKTTQEKQTFFTSLIDRLREFDEEMIAIQLGSLLLSRMVLLDTTAQLCVIPYLLKVKNSDEFELPAALFSPVIFTKIMLPKIMEIFCVRDAQIRLILLEYFTFYMKYIQLDDLKEQILPQLLLGIKDTNDILVAATLRCLADLIPILGASIVIGRNRERLFADGRPQQTINHMSKNGSDSKIINVNSIETNTIISNNWNTLAPRSITPVLNNGKDLLLLTSNSPTLDNVDISESITSTTITNRQIGNLMPERLSPDGGEDYHTNSDVLETEENEDAWSDWENDPILENSLNPDDENINNNNNNNNNSVATVTTIFDKIDSENTQKLLMKNEDTSLKTSENNFIIDVKNIEIKNQNDFDFFKDMEPVIQKTNVMFFDKNFEQDTNNRILNVPSSQTEPPKSSSPANITIDKSRFEIKNKEEDGDEEGWNDDDTNDW